MNSFVREVANNSHGAYLAIEELWRRGVILLPEDKKKWGCCGFGEVLRFLLSPFITVKQVPLAVAPPSPAQLAVSVGRSFA